MLRRLGLLFAHRAQHRNQDHVDECNIIPPHQELELSERLKENFGLDVADRATNLAQRLETLVCMVRITS